MDCFFESRLEWYAERTLAGKVTRGEIAAAITYAREVIRLRELCDNAGVLHSSP